MRIRLAIGVLAVGIIVGLATLFLVVLPGIRRVAAQPVVYDTSTLLKQVQGLSQLVTVKFVLEKIVIKEDAVFFYGDSRVILLAHGVVKAGVDLAGLTQEHVHIEGRNVVITLPPPVITDVYLDEGRTQVIERATGLLRRFDKTLEQSARQIAVGDFRRAARSGGILQEAEARAQEQISSMCRTLQFEAVTFRRPQSNLPAPAKP